MHQKIRSHPIAIGHRRSSVVFRGMGEQSLGVAPCNDGGIVSEEGVGGLAEDLYGRDGLSE